MSEKPKLRVIEGGAETGEVKKPIPSWEHTTGPGLFSIGFADLTMETFRNLLTSIKPTVIVDIRGCPSFYSTERGITRRRVLAMFEEMGIAYERAANLACRGHESSQDARMRSYEQYLRSEQMKFLDRLFSRTWRERILLLGHDPTPRKTEQVVIMNLFIDYTKRLDRQVIARASHLLPGPKLVPKDDDR